MKYLLFLSMLFFVSAATCETKVDSEAKQTSTEEAPYIDAEQDSGSLSAVEDESDNSSTEESEESASGIEEEPGE